jgi:hypothetical protein
MSILPELESNQARTGLILALTPGRTELAMERSVIWDYDIDFIEQRFTICQSLF